MSKSHTKGRSIKKAGLAAAILAVAAILIVVIINLPHSGKSASQGELPTGRVEKTSIEDYFFRPEEIPQGYSLRENYPRQIADDEFTDFPFRVTDAYEAHYWTRKPRDGDRVLPPWFEEIVIKLDSPTQCDEMVSHFSSELSEEDASGGVLAMLTSSDYVVLFTLRHLMDGVELENTDGIARSIERLKRRLGLRTVRMNPLLRRAGKQLEGGKSIRSWEPEDAGKEEGQLEEERLPEIRPKTTSQNKPIYFKWPFDAAEAKRRQKKTSLVLRISESLKLDLRDGVSMELVLIPAGKFIMGSPASEVGPESNEGPQHEVRISQPFYMGIFEVTQAQYRMVMDKNPSDPKDDNHPVNDVDWHDAVEFCSKLSAKTGRNFRLPTEAEWEYACRAGTQTRYSFGDNDAYLHKHGNYCDISNTSNWSWQDTLHDDRHDKTAPVGSYKPNAFGLYDMHGNVLEWCSDSYAESYADAGSVDPQGPSSGGYRVLRGGDWLRKSEVCRSAQRFWSGPSYEDVAKGFRVVLVP